MSAAERRQVRRVECYSLKQESGGFLPVWSFVENNKQAIACLIINISKTGFSLLINKQHGALPDRADLTIRDQSNRVLISLKASLNLKWKREDFSIDSTLIGVLIQPDKLDDIQQLKTLMTHASTEEFDYLRCSVLPLND